MTLHPRKSPDAPYRLETRTSVSLKASGRKYPFGVLSPRWSRTLFQGGNAGSNPAGVTNPLVRPFPPRHTPRKPCQV